MADKRETRAAQTEDDYGVRTTKPSPKDRDSQQYEASGTSVPEERDDGSDATFL